MIKIKNGLITLIAVVILSACLSSPHNPENSVATITEDTLENGLTYAIHAKHDNSQKIQLRLFIKSGSLSETNEQIGYAHLLEHMAFNGTKNFPKNKIIELFEESGLTFGHDINAYTGYAETVYTLTVPASEEKLLKSTLLYLRDILNDIEFDQAELDKEKGVVQSEYRLRMPQEPPYYFAFLLDYIAGSQYQKHLPIGTLESVGNSTEQSVKDFYKHWYRTNNAKVLITGDVNGELTQRLIINTFKDLEKPKNEQQQVVAEAPRLNTESKAFSSKLITFSQTDLLFEIPYKQIKTVEQLSESIKLDMLDKMFNYRLNVLNRQRALPFNEVSFSYIPILNNKSFKNISITYQKGNATKAAIFIAQELARLEQYGFNQAEYDLQYEALKAQQSDLKDSYLNQTSAEIADQVIDSWKTGETLFTLEQEQMAHQKALSSVTLSEINQLTNKLISTPTKLTLAYPYESKKPNLLLIDSSFNENLNKPMTKTDIKIEKIVLPIIKRDTAITPIKIEKFYPEKNMTQFTLNNGVDVVLQPDNSIKNSISMSFSASGGVNALTEKQIAANTLFINTFANSGLVGLTLQALDQKFINAKAELIPYVSNNDHGFTMQSINNPKSLKLVFSLLYSAINDAKIKSEIFKQQKEILINDQKSFLQQPTTATQLKFLQALFPNNPYQHIFSVEELQAIQQTDVEALHSQLFNSVNGYKLTIVGDFNLDEMKTLILQYIAPLQGGKLHQFNQHPQSLIHQATQLNEATNPQDNAIVTFTTLTDNKNRSIKEVYQADLMQRIVTQTLYKEVREKLSLTYSPEVYIASQQSGDAFTEVFIKVVTKTEDAQKTQQVIKRILNDFITKGITKKQLIDHQLGLTKSMLLNLNESTDRQWFLHRDHLQGYELGSTENAETIVNSISLEDMNLFMKTYLDPSKTVQMINTPQI